jgi:predicted dehydrogenase
MNKYIKPSVARREFLKTTGRAAAATALAGALIPNVHAAENNTIQVALIGCGGRGTGAAADAMSVKRGPVKLVAVADVFADHVKNTCDLLKPRFNDQVDVPADRQFVGFDAYQKAIDCLKPGDVAIFATPLAFRPVHFEYAIKKGVHSFMEKPLSADGPKSRRLLKLGEEASAKNLKVAVGLMARHARPMQELAQRIHDGAIGEILLMRSYREHGPVATFFSTPRDPSENELLWQIRRFHSFIWTSGGAYNDAGIHVIDGCCWMKDAWPVMAQAVGGRHYRDGYIDQNFDSYGVEYTFPDQTKLMYTSRFMVGCQDEFASFASGTKGSAVISKSGDCGAPSSIYKSPARKKANLAWESKTTPEESNPYQNEWNDYIEAIRNDKPYSEVKRGVEASIVSSMGRIAAHTGQNVTFDDVLNSDIELAPDADKFTMASPAPVLADAHGKYPVPMPGITVRREY